MFPAQWGLLITRPALISSPSPITQGILILGINSDLCYCLSSHGFPYPPSTLVLRPITVARMIGTLSTFLQLRLSPGLRKVLFASALGTVALALAAHQLKRHKHKKKQITAGNGGLKLGGVPGSVLPVRRSSSAKKDERGSTAGGITVDGSAGTAGGITVDGSAGTAGGITVDGSAGTAGGITVDGSAGTAGGITVDGSAGTAGGIAVDRREGGSGRILPFAF
uniref:Uncharacterized protein n=1 Tax=Xenopus tropicalis TaxID=8364 RepID=A0A1B8Y5H8_XENTR